MSKELGILCRKKSVKPFSHGDGTDIKRAHYMPCCFDGINGGTNLMFKLGHVYKTAEGKHVLIVRESRKYPGYDAVMVWETCS